MVTGPGDRVGPAEGGIYYPKVITSLQKYLTTLKPLSPQTYLRSALAALNYDC